MATEPASPHVMNTYGRVPIALSHGRGVRVWGFLDGREIYGKAARVLVNFSDLHRAWTRL